MKEVDGHKIKRYTPCVAYRDEHDGATGRCYLSDVHGRFFGRLQYSDAADLGSKY